MLDEREKADKAYAKLESKMDEQAWDEKEKRDKLQSR